jgi:hypothetical protein
VGLVIDAAPAGVRTGNATTSKTISAALRDTVYHRYAAQRTNGQNPKRRTKALLRRVVPDLNEVGLVDLIPNPMHPGQPGPKKEGPASVLVRSHFVGLAGLEPAASSLSVVMGLATHPGA